jgi:UPF0271 protein
MDLNADVGEGFGKWTCGDDRALLDVVTSANVACGFHAGDPATMRDVCRLAADRGVAIGAHVGYRDLAGFGRRFIDMEPAVLRAEVVYQLGALGGCARGAGASVRYVKPHGALYNAVVNNAAQAAAVVEAIAEYDSSLAVLGLAGSQLLALAQRAELRTVGEAFADRAYAPDGRLISRSAPGSMISNAARVAERCVRIAAEGVVDTVDGSCVPTRAESICVHGDTPNASRLARAIRTALGEANIDLRTFVEQV